MNNRQVKVTIGGVEFTNDVLDEVRVTMGARTPWEQNAAGNAQVRLLTEQPDVGINDVLEVEVESGVTFVPIFTGQVGLVQNQIEEFGPVWTVQATGPLTRAGRRTVGTAIPADTDGDQIAELADAGLGTQWQGSIGDWSEQTLTWDGFAVDKTNIDQPGLYDLAAITQTDANVLDEITRAALSASGWLYETRTGLIGYADSARRENTPQADYLIVPGDIIARRSFQTVTDEGELANSITVSYDGGETTVSSTTSMGLYGKWERSYDTSLADSTAAIDFIIRRLEIDATPRPTLASPLLIDLDQADSALIDDLLLMERNYGIVVEDVPTYVAAEGVYRGFVEGYVWVLDPVLPVLEVYVSEYSLSNFGLRWAAAGPTRWNQVGASLTWQDATEDLA